MFSQVDNNLILTDCAENSSGLSSPPPSSPPAPASPAPPVRRPIDQPGLPWEYFFGDTLLKGVLPHGVDGRGVIHNQWVTVGRLGRRQCRRSVRVWVSGLPE